MELQRLAAVTGRQDLEDHAVGIIRMILDAAIRSPLGFTHALAAVDVYTSEMKEIVIVGEPGDGATRALIDTARSRFLPNSVVVVAAPDDPLMQRIPLLQQRTMIDGKPTAYVCTRGVCKLPVTTTGALLEQLEA